MPKDVLEHLREIANSKAIEADDGIDAFLELVDQSARLYWSSKGLEHENLPGIVRNELKKANEMALKLANYINKLGGTSRHYLYATREDSSLEKFHGSLDYVISQIKHAFSKARNDSRAGGRPEGFARREFAAMVAFAIRSRLGEEPTTKRHGLFEEVLVTALEAIEQREVKSVKDLMRAALKMTVVEEHDGALISIIPAGE